MKITIHRGSKQIGGSCVEVQSDDGARILLDVGMPLTRPDGSDWPRGTMTRPGEDLRRENVLPNVDGIYRGSTPNVSALILSHSHLDHYGLAHHVHPAIPVYSSRGTTAMLRASKLFIPDAAIPENLHELPASTAVSFGPFSVLGIPVDHAAPDSRALLVECDGQRLLYSGDLRAHGRRRHLLDTLVAIARPLDVLILEGTTVGQPRGSHGHATESDVETRLTELLRQDPGLVAVIASGQNVDRATSVYNAALAAGRELVIDPYQAYILMVLKDICPEIPQFDSPSVRVKFIRSHVERLKEADLWPLACRMSRAGKVSAKQLAANPKGFVYLARSSGATVALLRYLLSVGRPTVVWSQWRGYLEKDGPVQLFCKSHAIQPIAIHSGGHAHPEDLADLALRLQPKVIVPIHTQAPKQFETFLPNVRVLPDGEAAEIASLISSIN